MVLFLAFSIQDKVEEYGAYVGLAAFLGLAVLTLLYFAQARELKRLRDWAGRAPERAQELEARVVAQADEARRAAEAPVPQPVTAAASGNGRQAGAPAAIPLGPRPAVAMAAAATAIAAPPEAAPPVSPEQAGDDGAPAPAGIDGAPTALVGAPAQEGEAATGAGGADARPPVGAAPPAEAVPGEEPAETVPGGPAHAAPDEPAEAAAAGAPAGDDTTGAGDEAAPAAHDTAPAGDDNVAAEPAPAGGDDGAAAIPRATPRPQPKPVPAAPLRAGTSASATLPPRRRPVRDAASSSALRATLLTLGVVVVAAGLAYGATRIFAGDETTPPPNRTAVSGTTPTAAGGTSERIAALRPETVVAILNGTPTEGLASSTRDKLMAEGYSDEQGMIRTGNTIDQQRQDSVVLYATGKRRQARDVASIIGVDAVEQVDADTQALADSTDDTGSGRHADVVAILGADQSP
jgi:hypothetical protein